MQTPFDNMTQIYNEGNQKGEEDINIESIHADGTLGKRFTKDNGWTTKNGKLPGLLGNTVNMPKHLR